jgi:hypothetical protein
MCTTLSTLIKDSGFTGECGYNVLLYPTAGTTRALLGFFARRLVSEEGEDMLADTGAVSQKSILETVADVLSHGDPNVTIARGAITTKLDMKEIIPKHYLSRPWNSRKFQPEASLVTELVPESKQPYGAYVVPTLLDASRRRSAITERKRKLAEYKLAAKSRGDQPTSIADMVANAMGKSSSGNASVSLADMIKNVIDLENNSGASNSSFNNNVNFGQEAVKKKEGGKANEVVEEGEDPEEKRRREEEATKVIRDAELAALRATLEEILTTLRQQNDWISEKDVVAEQCEADGPAIKKAIEELTRQYKMKKSMLDMLPDAENNMAKLLAIVEDATKRMALLEDEWDKVRQPLVDELEKKKGSRDAAAEITKNKLMAIKQMRNDISSMATEIREKEALAITLKAEYEKMPKNINRTAYTYRIMDIIKQISKQQAEIKKVVGDVKEVQKDINKMGDTLARTEAVADEVLWQKGQQNDTKKMTAGQREAAKESYKSLAKLRSTFDTLIDSVTYAGKADNTAREYETKTESLLQRVSGQSVEQTLKDLEEVKQENMQVAAKIKKAMGK